MQVLGGSVDSSAARQRTARQGGSAGPSTPTSGPSASADDRYPDGFAVKLWLGMGPCRPELCLAGFWPEVCSAPAMACSSFLLGPTSTTLRLLGWTRGKTIAASPRLATRAPTVRSASFI